jgi:pyruvyltransferase
MFRDYPMCLTSWLWSKLGQRNLRVYWYNRGLNFGDLITPYLLTKYGFQPRWTRPEFAQFVSTGSVLQKFRRPFTGVVLGSGFIAEKYRGDMFQSAVVLGVRGVLTCRKLGRDPSLVVLGDPGLLCAKFIGPPPAKKRWKVGIVPHFVDAQSQVVSRLKALHGEQLAVIDVRRQPEEVWKDLVDCEFVLSSSLHGLVCADALGIPTRWITLSDNVLGSGFKFRDYYSAFSENVPSVALRGTESIAELASLCQKRDATRLRSLINSLDDSFTSFANDEPAPAPERSVGRNSALLAAASNGRHGRKSRFPDR